MFHLRARIVPTAARSAVFGNLVDATGSNDFKAQTGSSWLVDEGLGAEAEVDCGAAEVTR